MQDECNLNSNGNKDVWILSHTAICLNLAFNNFSFCVVIKTEFLFFRITINEHKREAFKKSNIMKTWEKCIICSGNWFQFDFTKTLLFLRMQSNTSHFLYLIPKQKYILLRLIIKCNIPQIFQLLLINMATACASSRIRLICINRITAVPRKLFVPFEFN